MTTRKRRESVQRVIVVLEGEKITTDKTGVAPLLRASNYVSNNNNTVDEILVLALLSVDGSGPSSSRGFRGNHRCNHTCEDDRHSRFLRHQVSQKKEDYKRIFRPFYERCKNNGVKFLVKVAAGYQPKDIITEEANNVGVTWIILDSSFAKHLTFQLSGIECNVSLVSDEEGVVADDHWIAEDKSSDSSLSMEVIHNPKSPKMMKGSTSQQKPDIWPSTDRELEKETNCEPLKGNEISRQVEPTKTTCHDVPCRNLSTRVCQAANFMVEKPKQLSWEVITEITERFSTRAWNEHEKSYSTYIGYFDHRRVLVKRFMPLSTSILEAEMRAAFFMNHRNITVITGYHQSENGTILIFPLLQGMTLDRYIWGSERRELKFEARLKIAIAIAQGIRYMHEECPQSPVVHGELHPRNIFLTRDLQPMISNFGKAAWLHHEQLSLNSKNRYLMYPLSHDTMKLVKRDVLSFGVLLLRLFCRTSAPEDDKSLVEWARPLMLKRKFYEILEEEDSECSDIHGIYRVMAAANGCTRSKPISRPYMTQVISILKGEHFCNMQMYPSDTSI